MSIRSFRTDGPPKLTIKGDIDRLDGISNVSIWENGRCISLGGDQNLSHWSQTPSYAKPNLKNLHCTGLQLHCTALHCSKYSTNCRITALPCYIFSTNCRFTALVLHSCRSSVQYQSSRSLPFEVRVQWTGICSAMSALQVDIYCTRPAHFGEEINTVNAMKCPACSTAGRLCPLEILEKPFWCMQAAPQHPYFVVEWQ